MLNRFLSYFFPVRVEETSSAMHPKMWVHLYKGRYRLSTEKAVYSWEDLYSCYRVALKAEGYDSKSIESLLVLGFGLGAVPKMLKKFGQDGFKSIGVELDPKIIELNKEYGYSLQAGDEIYCKDAIEFVKQDRESYDLIVLDVFIEEIVPDSISTASFYSDVANRLKQNGAVLHNRMTDTAELIKSAEKAFEEFKAVFPNAKIIETGSNQVFVAYKELGRKSNGSTL